MYYLLGKKYKIYDLPNERSSHHTIVVRGAGIVLLCPTLVLLFLTNDVRMVYLTIGLAIGTITGFLDDAYTLPASIRFVFYLVAIGVLLFCALSLGGFGLYISVGVMVVMLGAVNAYNFMDGINGMSAAYSVVFLATCLYLETHFLNQIIFKLQFGTWHFL